MEPQDTQILSQPVEEECKFEELLMKVFETVSQSSEPVIYKPEVTFYSKISGLGLGLPITLCYVLLPKVSSGVLFKEKKCGLT